VLLTHRGLHQKLPSLTATIVKLDDDWKIRISHYERSTPVNNVGPDDLAYVIYTSG